MKTLDEIAIEHGTDKATVFPKGIPHCYTPAYARAFDAVRNNNPLKVLEIGVGGGESIRTWLDYFPYASVYGVDIVQGTNPWNTVGAEIHSRYRFVTGDQSHDVFWKCFIVDYGMNWDIIIDDGGHFSNQVITAFNSMWDYVRPGGLYCIEDLGVCIPGSIFTVPGCKTHLEFLMDLELDLNCGRRDLDHIHLSRELAIIKKSP